VASRALLVAAAAVLVLGLLGTIALGPARERLAFKRRLDDRVPQVLAASARLSARAAPPELAAGGWPSANGDLQNTRAARGSAIRAANVRTLHVAWTLPLRGAGEWGAAASGLLVSRGVVYFQDLTSDVYALDLRTGAVRWLHRSGQKAFGPNGPALGYGRVYAQDGDDHVVALSAADGHELWQSLLGGPTGQQQPVVFGGAVYTGIAAARRERGAGVVHTGLLRPGASGHAYALRADDGRLAWDVRTMTAGDWGNPAQNGGGGIWFSPAIDEATGTTYWDTGNPGPAPGTVAFPNGTSRPGPNRWSNSVLALDGRTGKPLWRRQVLPHDLLHHDLQNAPILVRAGGRKLLVASGKMGVVYALDARTGARVWTRPVGRHEHDTLPRYPRGRGVLVYPGFWGGVETPGATADGVLYFQVDDLPTPYEATAWGAKDGRESVQHLESRTVYATGTSSLVALDAATGKPRWTHHFRTVGFGAATVVNDLVVTSTYDGVVYALRRSDGSEAWHMRLPAGIIAWPAVSGDTIVVAAGLGTHPVLVALRLGRHG
jgi:outer membrane protein assembly factor BamB